VRRFVALAFGALAVATSVPAGAEGVGNDEPQGSATVAFAADFPIITDDEWGFPVGGFGGTGQRSPLSHVPVVFVHGNNVDAADWYPVRDDFRAAGWTDQELWALSYNGLGGDNGSFGAARPNPDAETEHADAGHDCRTRVTSNEPNVPDLHAFLVAVRAYTGSDRFSIVAHSLGVTLARRTLETHPELRDDLVAFVGIAGPNHGTSFCPPGSEGVLNSCDEIAAGTSWLAELNGPDGADETYGPARWLTVSDGTGQTDVGFAGPNYAESPQLHGADNRTFGLSHNDLRLDPEVVVEYRTFLEETEATSVEAPTPLDPPAAVEDVSIAPPRPTPSPPARRSPAVPAPAIPVAVPVAGATPLANPVAAPTRSPSLPQVPVVASAASGTDVGRYRFVLALLVAMGFGLWRLNDRLWPRTPSP